MPWIIGIDEAGYGPNLGPFVMSAVACRVPAELEGANLWHVLDAGVRSRAVRNDRRVFIADSKIVYSTGRGLCGLELGVLATVLASRIDELGSLSEYIDEVCPAQHPELGQEAWYTGASVLPVLAGRDLLGELANRFESTSQTSRVCWGPLRSVVVAPSRFNELVCRGGTKAAVLGQALAELVGFSEFLDDPREPLRFFIDKHGGRNRYAVLLQEALPAGCVVVRDEGASRSVYDVLGLARPIRFTFQPRADAEHFCVALASMASKYLRELLMLEFNRYWRSHVPGLKPTAGYPGDAGRFFKTIQPVLQKLGIAETAVWRNR